jgi:hypothetical protein
MSILVKTFLAIALVVGAAVALLFSGEHMSEAVIGSRMMSSGARFGELVGYVVLILLIAALGSVVAWMLFAKTE